MEESIQITEPREQMLIGIIESLSKDLELIKLKDIADVKTGIKVLNAKLDKILVGQEEAKHQIASLQPDSVDLIKTFKPHSDTIGEITKALAKVAAMGIKVSTTGGSNHGESETLDDYFYAFEIPLGENGLKVKFVTWETAHGQEYIITILSHSSGEFFKSLSFVTPDEGILKNGGYNKALAAGKTYAKKNAYAAMMGR